MIRDDSSVFLTAKVHVGPYHSDIYQWLKQRQEENKLRIPEIADKAIHEIISGEAGCYKMFGDAAEENTGYLKAGLDNIELEELSETPDSKISINLMRSVVRLVEQSALELGLQLDADQRARTYAAAYNYAINTNATVDTLDPAGILAAIDAVR